MELKMIKKTYLKTKPKCKVKFALSTDIIGDSQSVSVVGDFNNWDASLHPLRKQKSGVFTSTLNLEIDHTYQFRYLVDNQYWLNDDMADAYVPSPLSQDSNGVLNL
jgi:1,4-alpha-glucan branching enzyme